LEATWALQVVRASLLAGGQELSHVHGGRRASESGGGKDAGNLASMVDKLMSKNFIDTGSLGWVIVQYFSDQISCSIGNGYVLRERICIHSDTLVCRFNITCLKRRLSYDQSIYNNSQ